MKNYEVTFIVDPVLSGDEIKATAQTYVDLLKNENCNIVHVDDMGLRPLAYSLNKRQSGVYYCIEFEAEDGNFVGNLELSLRRDERIMRFLTVSLDKYGVKYNDDKRKGLIGKKRLEKQPAEKVEATKPVERERPQPKPIEKVQSKSVEQAQPKPVENVQSKSVEQVQPTPIEKKEAPAPPAPTPVAVKEETVAKNEEE